MKKMIGDIVYSIMSQQSKTLLEFCPKCQTLLSTEKDEADVLLKCSNCDYTRPISGLHMIHSNKHKAGAHTTKQVPYATVYDDAVTRTTRIKCRNEDCASLDPGKWGSTTERGFKVEPSVLVATAYDPDRIATYICRICGHIFRP